MKHLLLKLSFLLLLFLSGCTENSSCDTCQIIFTSNEAQVCGLANDGIEEIRRVNVGEVCDDESKRLLIQENTSSEQVPASCGKTFTLWQRVECK